MLPVPQLWLMGDGPSYNCATMKTIRIIPRLDIKGPNLVKGIHLEGLRVLGKPENFARYYYEQGADELLYMDVVASLYGRNNLLDIVRKTSREIFIPLTVGGGLRSLDDMHDALRAGADKVAINTSAIQNPEIVREAANKFGSSTVVVSIEVIKKSDGSYEVFMENGRQETGKDAIQWASQVTSLGAGEILLTSIDREGTGKGYDVTLTKKISSMVSIPVIACGGAGKKEHVLDVVRDGFADAVSMASILHYDFVRNSLAKEDFENEGNTEFLKSQKNFKQFNTETINSVKRHLNESGIACRL